MRFALVATLLLASLAPAQEDAFLARLESGDREVVLKALRESGDDVPSVDALRRMVVHATGRDAPVAHAARNALDSLGIKLVPRLLRIAPEGGRLGATTLRLVGRYAGGAAAAKLVPFLDHDDRRLRQAAAALLAEHGHQVVDAVRERLFVLRERLRGGERSDDLDLRVADHLAVLSGLTAVDALERISEIRELASERLLGYTDAILARDQPAAFRAIAANQLRSGDERNARYLMRFLVDRGDPADRRLGFELWRKRQGTESAPLITALERILEGTSAWLGILVPPADVEAVEYDLVITNARKGIETEHHLSADQDATDLGRLLRGVLLEFPLGEVLMNPAGCRFELVKKDGRASLSTTRERAMTHRFGIGHVVDRSWDARFGFDVSRIETELDDGGLPVSSRFFDTAGKEVGRARYPIAKARDGHREIVIESGSLSLTARYVPSVGGGLRLASATIVDEARPEGSRLWLDATVNDFRVRRAPPEDR